MHAKQPSPVTAGYPTPYLFTCREYIHAKQLLSLDQAIQAEMHIQGALSCGLPHHSKFHRQEYTCQTARLPVGCWPQAECAK
jgi:hypothetical protein